VETKSTQGQGGCKTESRKAALKFNKKTKRGHARRCRGKQGAGEGVIDTKQRRSEGNMSKVTLSGGDQARALRLLLKESNKSDGVVACGMAVRI